MGPKYFFVLTIRKMIKILIFEIQYCFSALLKSDIMTYMVTYKFILKNRYFKNLCEFINSCDIHHLIYHFYFYENLFFFFFFFFFF